MASSTTLYITNLLTQVLDKNDQKLKNVINNCLIEIMPLFSNHIFLKHFYMILVLTKIQLQIAITSSITYI